jgi:hypothetical protein
MENTSYVTDVLKVPRWKGLVLGSKGQRECCAVRPLLASNRHSDQELPSHVREPANKTVERHYIGFSRSIGERAARALACRARE